MLSLRSTIDFDSTQYSIFKDCLTTRVLSIPGYHDPSSPSNDDEGSELDEFTSYLASEIWPSIPSRIRDLTHASTSVPTREDMAELVEELDIPASFSDTLTSYGLVSQSSSSASDSLTFLLPVLTHASTSVPTREDMAELVEELDIPASFSDTLTSYGLVSQSSSSASDSLTFLLPVLTFYLVDATAAPQQPNWSATRALVDGCELCGRDVPLTYHHLIPRSVHDKVVKRGWHEERMLGKVAWLCRPCHSAIHGMMSNEELARDYHTVELLLTREDVQRWAKYAARQRWGARRG